MEEFELVPENSIFFDLTPDEVTAFFVIVGFLLSQPLTIDELNLLGNGFFLLGEVLIVMAAQRTLLNDALKAEKEHESHPQKKEGGTEKVASEIQQLKKQIQQLQNQISKLEKG